ncbi:MAG: DUF664 domain-containing protein [Acidimicrobiia bacterium]|nr:DUF664 domain-containing protein [Acidimicrobiia bacterium]
MMAPGLLPEFDQEMAVTRRLLERSPAGSFDWTPHPKSFTLGALSTHLTRIPRWGERILTQPDYDLTSAPATPPPPHATPAEVLAAFDAAVGAVRQLLTTLSEAELQAPWQLKRNGDVMLTVPRVAAFKSFVINHSVHHRGQLSVYLRLLDVPVPAMYGPTADERM